MKFFRILINRSSVYGGPRAIKGKLPTRESDSKCLQSLTNLVSKRAKFIVDFETVGVLWVNSLCDEISSLVFRRVKNRSNLIFLVNKPESVIFEPENPSLIFFQLTRKRISIMLNILNFPFPLVLLRLLLLFLQTKSKCSKIECFLRGLN